MGYSSERRRTESAADLDEIPALLALVLCGWDGREGRDRRGEEKKRARAGFWEVNTGDYDQTKERMKGGGESADGGRKRQGSDARLLRPPALYCSHTQEHTHTHTLEHSGVQKLRLSKIFLNSHLELMPRISIELNLFISS